MSQGEETGRRGSAPGADPTLVQARDGETLAEAAYQALRTDIISGARPQRNGCGIEHLSKLYNVGPTPLREALQRLCADGLVLASGNRGFSVAPLDPDEFIDLNIARIAVEKEALRLSIVNGDNEWEAGVVAGRLAAGQGRSGSGPRRHGQPGQLEKANDAFHGAMVAACGSTGC